MFETNQASSRCSTPCPVLFRFIPEFGAEAPEAGSTMEGLLNRSSLMDVAFRGMQRQHSLIFIAALEDPTAERVVPYINFQSYPDFDMSHEGYLKWGENAVSTNEEYTNVMSRTCLSNYNSCARSNDAQTYIRSIGTLTILTRFSPPLEG